eukprot:GEMP01059269.1.p1 GENE.GEMP01059269.1~~GEMP01059269.1.p1  ORF type:complete len:349 (+),score=78.92 GEMP01059269.1:53-1099(+)
MDKDNPFAKYAFKPSDFPDVHHADESVGLVAPQVKKPKRPRSDDSNDKSPTRKEAKARKVSSPDEADPCSPSSASMTSRESAEDASQSSVVSVKSANGTREAGLRSSKKAKLQSSPDKLLDPDLDGLLQPRLTGTPRGWRERWRGVCDECFIQGTQCYHFDERPLKLLFLGHNPSDMTWEKGFAYANPSNRFWGLVRNHILPAEYRQDDPLWKVNNLIPHELLIGLTDLGCEKGSDAASFSRQAMISWQQDFAKRAAAHKARCNIASYKGPAIVAFTGKRQFCSLFHPPLAKCEFGLWHGPRPPYWPFDSLLFVLPSTSGRAVISHEDRAAPYRRLGDLLKSCGNLGK